LRTVAGGFCVQRDDEIPQARSAGRRPVRGRGAEQEDQGERDQVGLERDDERVLRDVALERGDELTRRHAQEDGDDRQQQEAERERRRQDERAAEETVYDDAFGSGRNPAFLSAVWPFADRTILTHACAAALFGDFDTTAIS